MEEKLKISKKIDQRRKKADKNGTSDYNTLRTMVDVQHVLSDIKHQIAKDYADKYKRGVDGNLQIGPYIKYDLVIPAIRIKKALEAQGRSLDLNDLADVLEKQLRN